MQAIADYTGNLLGHVEALYRPGERELALELVAALGCAVTDTGFASNAGTTFLAIHPNPADRNVQNNVFYISEMTREHQALERRLARLAADDGEFHALLEDYREKARTRPFGVPHFALRYRSSDEVEAVAERIGRTLAPKLCNRLHLRIFRPGEADAAVDDLIQGFLYQDVIVSGSFLHGQLIELQTPARTA